MLLLHLTAALYLKPTVHNSFLNSLCQVFLDGSLPLQPTRDSFVTYVLKSVSMFEL